MSYVGGSYLSGDLPTAETLADSTSTSLQEANFKRAYQYLQSLTPAQRAQIEAVAQRAIARLPASQRQEVQAIAARTSQTDPRAAPGLGVFGLESIAKIASITATLGTLGLQTFSFLDQQKQQKKQASAQNKQANAEAAAVQADIATQQIRAQQASAQPAPKTNFIIPAAIVGGGLALVAVVFAMRRSA